MLFLPYFCATVALFYGSIPIFHIDKNFKTLNPSLKNVKKILYPEQAWLVINNSTYTRRTVGCKYVTNKYDN